MYAGRLYSGIQTEYLPFFSISIFFPLFNFFSISLCFHFPYSGEILGCNIRFIFQARKVAVIPFAAMQSIVKLGATISLESVM